MDGLKSECLDGFRLDQVDGFVGILTLRPPDPIISQEFRIARKSLAAKEKLSLGDNAGAQSGTHLALPPTMKVGSIKGPRPSSTLMKSSP
jgi:hypothetical protein